MTRIVLAYPHAVPIDHDAAISWLAGQGGEIVTLMLDLGQGRELEALRDRAFAAGAVRAHVLDAAGEFAAQFLLPALKAGALYLDGRPIAPGLAGMITAQKLVEIAGIEQTKSVAHGYGEGDRGFAAAVRSRDPSLTLIALPASVLLPLPGDLAPRVPTADRRVEAAFVDLTFVRGAPTAINGVTMPLTDLIGSIEMLAGSQGVGRLDREESPAAIVLHRAHHGLQESRISDRSELNDIARRYVDLIDTGAWFSSERKALDSSVARLEARVSGTVRLRLSNDACDIVEIAA